MLTSKYINAITAIGISLCLVISVFLVGFSGTEASSKLSSTTQPEYVSKLFGSDLMTIDIEVDESTWNTMIQNARSEEYISCDITINGTKFESVGLRPKGNSSLTMVDSDTERYSFKLNFSKYINGQTCYGLDTMVLNNMISDATYMKEYISYDIMRYIGVDTPMFTYAAISVNGEYKGLYLAIEKYEQSFMERTYSTNNGQLYNVKSMDIGGGKGMNAFRDVESDNQTGTNLTSATTQPSDSGTANPSGNRSFDNMGDGIGGNMGRSGGGSFVYTDDNSDSYSSIFGNSVFDTADESAYQRTIAAIKALNEGTDIESYFDVDKLIRYFAAHTFVVNLDSYVSSMQQNYYVYEQDGKITILPWDYNLAFGGFQSGSASSVVNFPIDTPTSGVELSDRPLLNVIFENENYKAKYHQYLQEIVDGYFNSGVFTSTIDSLNSVIGSYIQNEAKAFYTYEEYAASLPVFKQLGLLRAQSVSGQLNGAVPSTTETQNQDSSKLVDASSISLSALGSQGGGKDGMDMHNGGSNFGNRKDRFNQDSSTSSETQNSNIQSSLNLSVSKLSTVDNSSASAGNMQPPDMPNGGQMPDFGQMPNGGNYGQGDQQAPSNDGTFGQMPDMGEMPDFGNIPDNATDFSSTDKTVNPDIWWTLGSLVVMAIAALFVKLYPRRY